MIAQSRMLAPLALFLALFSAALHAQGQPRDTARAPSTGNRPLSAAERQSYVGIYTVSLPQGGTTTLNVYEANGALHALPGNQDESQKLLYQGNNVFVTADDPNFVFVFVVENGRATKFTVRRADGLIEGVRSQ